MQIKSDNLVVEEAYAYLTLFQIQIFRMKDPVARLLVKPFSVATVKMCHVPCHKVCNHKQAVVRIAHNNPVTPFFRYESLGEYVVFLNYSVEL